MGLTQCMCLLTSPGWLLKPLPPGASFPSFPNLLFFFLLSKFIFSPLTWFLFSFQFNTESCATVLRECVPPHPAPCLFKKPKIPEFKWPLGWDKQHGVIPCLLAVTCESMASACSCNVKMPGSPSNCTADDPRAVLQVRGGCRSVQVDGC